MKLFTKSIERQLQAQYQQGSSMDQMVICKIFNPYGAGSWYVMNQDPDDPDYLWGIADIFEVETGSMSKSELEQVRIKIGGFQLALERDLYWKPRPAKEVWNELTYKQEV